MVCPHFTFLYSKLQSHTLWNHFLHEFIYIYFSIWSCTSSWQLRKYKWVEAHLVAFARFLLWFVSNFTFLHSKLFLNPFESFFFHNEYDFIYFYLVLYLQLVGSQEAEKHHRLEVQLAYLVDFARFFLWFAPILLFYTPSCSLTLCGIIFFGKNTFEFFLLFGLVLQLVGPQEAQKQLAARGKACIFSQLCPIFTAVCSFYFSALQISLTLLGILFNL